LIELHAAVALFGVAGLFGKWIEDATPLAITFGRMIFAAAALALWIGVAQRRRPVPAWPLAWNGALLAAHWAMFFAAIRASTVAIALVGYASFPLFVLLIERAWLGARYGARESVTTALVTSGLIVVVPDGSIGNGVLAGLAWGVASGAAFAILAVRNRDLASRHAAIDVAFAQNAWGAMLLLPIVLVADKAVPIRTGDLALLVALGVGCTAVAHTLFIAALGSVTAHTASVVAALEPVYGIALAWLALGEAPTPRTLAGAALIVAAAIVASRRRIEAEPRFG